jgi:cell division protein FtsL
MSISDHTVIMAIRAISAKTRQLETQIETADEDEVSYLEEELLDYSKAQMDLKRHYSAVQGQSDNLPPYDSLLG